MPISARRVQIGAAMAVLTRAARMPSAWRSARKPVGRLRILRHRDRADRLIRRQHRSAGQQQEFHAQAVAGHQHPAEMQQQKLGAGGKAVMPDQQQAAGPGAGGDAGDRAPGGVQEGRPVMQIGFQIGALRPFVPRVDADDRHAEEGLGSGAADRAFQPGLIFRRSRAVHHQAGPPGGGHRCPSRGSPSGSAETEFWRAPGHGPRHRRSRRPGPRTRRRGSAGPGCAASGPRPACAGETRSRRPCRTRPGSVSPNTCAMTKIGSSPCRSRNRMRQRRTPAAPSGISPAR